MVIPRVVIECGGRSTCLAKTWHGRDLWSDVAKWYAPVSGSAWLGIGGSTAGETAIDRDTTVELKAGAVYLVPPHCRQSFGTSERMVIDWLHFRVDPPWLDTRFAKIGRVVRVASADARRWRGVGRRLAEFFRGEDAGLACQVHAMLLEGFAAALQTAGPSVGVAGGGPAAWRLQPALDLIDASALSLQPPTLADIAGTVSLSPEHFHRLFTAAFDLTPMNYVLRRRMTQARILLAQNLLTVGEIADACGYADAFYFSRVFRNYYGRSPREYRKTLNGGP